ncbi:MAG: TIGR00725 family protein [Patescibacteria group bacterium]
MKKKQLTKIKAEKPLDQKRKLQIGVIGSASQTEYPGKGGASQAMEKAAEDIGFLLAQRGAVVVTGGKGGIMEAAARGAKRGGGVTVGIIKGNRRRTSNKFTDVEVLTGMEADGMDELFLVLMSDALIVLGGGAGTLQEIAIAYRNKKPVVVLGGMGGWGEKLVGKFVDERQLVKLIRAKTPKDAVTKVLSLV